MSGKKVLLRLTDFQNSLTDKRSSKFLIKQLLNTSWYLKCVATHYATLWNVCTQKSPYSWAEWQCVRLKFTYVLKVHVKETGIPPTLIMGNVYSTIYLLLPYWHTSDLPWVTPLPTSGFIAQAVFLLQHGQTEANSRTQMITLSGDSITSSRSSYLLDRTCSSRRRQRPLAPHFGV